MNIFHTGLPSALTPALLAPHLTSRCGSPLITTSFARWKTISATALLLFLSFRIRQLDFVKHPVGCPPRGSSRCLRNVFFLFTHSSTHPSSETNTWAHVLGGRSRTCCRETSLPLNKPISEVNFFVHDLYQVFF